MGTQQLSSTTALSSKLDDLIEDANSANKTIDSRVYALLSKCMRIFETEFAGVSEDELNLKVTELKRRLDAKKIRYLEKSPVLNLLVRFISGENTKTGSAHAHVMEVAMSKGISSEEFPKWVTDNNGIESIRKSFSRDGATKECSNPSRRHVRDNTDAHGSYARRQLQDTYLHQFNEHELTENLQTPVIDTEYAAILLHRPDGTLQLKAVAPDQSTVTQVLATISKFKGWSQRAEEEYEKEQLEALLKAESLKLIDVRAINGDLADECEDRWKNIRNFDDDQTSPPPDFDEYRALLAKGDNGHNLKPNSGDFYFECALEELEQLIESKPTLSNFLDRQWVPGISPHAEEMPRMKIHVSKHVNAAGGTYRTKRQTVYRRTVEARINELSQLASQPPGFPKPRMTATEVLARIAHYKASKHSAAAQTNLE